MKKVVSLIFVGALIIFGVIIFLVMNDKDELTPTNSVPTDNDTAENEPFKVVQEGDYFTIILDENPSTGYSWNYTLSDENKIELVNDKYFGSEESLVGAGGRREFSFKVNKDGASTITFKYSRGWEKDSVLETVEVLVSKNNNKVTIEEN